MAPGQPCLGVVRLVSQAALAQTNKQHDAWTVEAPELCDFDASQTRATLHKGARPIFTFALTSPFTPATHQNR